MVHASGQNVLYVKGVGNWVGVHLLFAVFSILLSFPPHSGFSYIVLRKKKSVQA